MRGRVLPVVVAATCLAGCEPTVTSLHIESYKGGAAGSRLTETFDECVYTSDDRGRWDIVFRSSRPSPSDAEGVLTQIFHARIFWQPIPGKTFVERTQTNAILCYALLDVGRAVSYDGAGFVSFSPDRSGDRIRGQIESGTLGRRRGSNETEDPLGPCLVMGEFVARRDAGTVVDALKLLRQRLGPLPIRSPKPTSPEVR